MNQEAFKFHYQFGLPPLPERFHKGIVRLNWGSRHAQDRIAEKGIDTFHLSFLNLGNAKIIEQGYSDAGRLVKILFRIHYDDKNDLLIATIPSADENFSAKSIFLVKTAWKNEKSDKHRTLDRSQYRIYKPKNDKLKKSA